MDSRRKFIGTMATGLATTLASPRGILGANDRIRAGIIGIGDRGTEIARQAMGCNNVDFVAFADIYTRRLESAKNLVQEPPPTSTIAACSMIKASMPF